MKQKKELFQLKNKWKKKNKKLMNKDNKQIN